MSLKDLVDTINDQFMYSEIYWKRYLRRRNVDKPIEFYLLLNNSVGILKVSKYTIINKNDITIINNAETQWNDIDGVVFYSDTTGNVGRDIVNLGTIYNALLINDNTIIITIKDEKTNNIYDYIQIQVYDERTYIKVLNWDYYLSHAIFKEYRSAIFDSNDDIYKNLTAELFTSQEKSKIISTNIINDNGTEKIHAILEYNVMLDLTTRITKFVPENYKNIKIDKIKTNPNKTLILKQNEFAVE